MREEGYRRWAESCRSVLDTLEGLKERGFWVEVVTLVIPGLNDSEEELRDAARFLARPRPRHSVARDGVSRRLSEGGPARLRPRMLLRAAEIGREAGLRFVYAGKPPRPGRGVGEHVLSRLRDVPRGAARIPVVRCTRDGRRRMSCLRRGGARTLDPSGPAAFR